MPSSAETLQRDSSCSRWSQDRFDATRRARSSQLAAVTSTIPISRRTIWLKAAAVLRHAALENVDGAVAAYNARSSSDDPGDRGGARRSLDALYRRTERWSDLVTVVRRRAELADGPRRSRKSSFSRTR